MKISRLVGVALAVSVCFSTSTIVAAQQQSQANANAPAQEKPRPNVQANPDAVVLVDFKARIDKYLELRKQAKKDAPPLKETTEPAAIQAAEEALAVRVRALRADAKPGDILTPEIRSKFRRLLSPEQKGEDGRDAKAVVKDDAPSPGTIPFKVNAKYPEGATLPSVPVNFLLNLPTLPKELEYRIIDKHLILRDTEANIIVDYIPSAIR